MAAPRMGRATRCAGLCTDGPRGGRPTEFKGESAIRSGEAPRWARASSAAEGLKPVELVACVCVSGRSGLGLHVVGLYEDAAWS